MLRSLEIQTNSRHYKLPYESGCIYAAPQKLSRDEASLKCSGNFFFFYKNKYILEQIKGCKPVYLVPFMTINRGIYYKLIDNASRNPANFYWQPVSYKRQRIWQEWKEKIL